MSREPAAEPCPPGMPLEVHRAEIERYQRRQAAAARAAEARRAVEGQRPPDAPVAARPPAHRVPSVLRAVPKRAVPRRRQQSAPAPASARVVVAGAVIELLDRLHQQQVETVRRWARGGAA